MRRANIVLPALLLPTLLQLPRPAVVPAGLSGRFYESEPSHPIAGALVALYERRTGLLIDSTYTRDTGDFTLRAPQSGEDVYLVATKGDIAQRKDLTWDPTRPAIDASIAYRPAPSCWGGLERYFSAKLETVASIVLGLVLGWLFNLLTGRIAARRKAKTVLRVYLLELAAEVRKAVEIYLAAWNALPAEKWRVSVDTYRGVTTRMTPPLEAVRVQLTAKSIEEDLYEIHGRGGVEALLDFRRRLRNLEGILELAVADLTGEQVASRLKDLHEGLLALQTHPLLPR